MIDKEKDVELNPEIDDDLELAASSASDHAGRIVAIARNGRSAPRPHVCARDVVPSLGLAEASAGQWSGDALGARPELTVTTIGAGVVASSRATESRGSVVRAHGTAAAPATR
jgi:hypothetical protein